MKKFILILGLIASISTFAGHETGNGGGVHYCPNRDVKVQFYDLYEGRNANPRKPIPVFQAAYDTEEIMLKNAVEKLSKVHPIMAAMVKEQLDFINVKTNIERVAKKLRPIDDANFLWVDEDCSYEQLANWMDNDDVLYVRESLMALLEKQPLDLAAFKMHEAIYKSARQYLDIKTSDEVRLLNAYLFSEADIPDSALTFVRTIKQSVSKMWCSQGENNISTSDRSEFKDWAKKVFNQVQTNEPKGKIICFLQDLKGKNVFDMFFINLHQLYSIAVEGIFESSFFGGAVFYGQKDTKLNTQYRFGMLNEGKKTDLNLAIGRIKLKPNSFEVDGISIDMLTPLFDIEKKKQLELDEPIIEGRSYLELSETKMIINSDKTVTMPNVKVRTFECKNKKCTKTKVLTERSTKVNFDAKLNMVIENW